MLRRFRIGFALLFYVCITLLFLDFTGSVHSWFGWMAKIQFLPAILSLNVVAVVFVLILTLIFGRIYCSVICPLGVMQDVISFLGGKRKKNRFSYSTAKRTLRIIFLVVLVIALIAGVGSIFALLAPYSSYGRIASNLFAPVYGAVNNVLALCAEHFQSYTFYEHDVYIKSVPTFAVSALTFIVIAVLAWRGGRTYCNTICPVGTVLGCLAKYSWFKPVIDTNKCNGCTLCSKNCKASCIDAKNHEIDYTRCVACMDCIGKCKRGAISLGHSGSKDVKTENVENVDLSKRSFLTAGALVVASGVAKAADKTIDGGLAPIIDKDVPKRTTPIVPPGALSIRNLTQHCTACQLCISVCPNNVLRPSTDLSRMMQPESSYEKGYCRPECTKCSEVCPAGAIKPITREEKTAIQIGHAVLVRKYCLSLNQIHCGNCAKHCPTGAIQMIPSDPKNENSPLMPSINVERCIGCGACENLCPSRPHSAIYVEGHEVHRDI